MTTVTMDTRVRAPAVPGMLKALGGLTARALELSTCRYWWTITYATTAQAIVMHSLIERRAPDLQQQAAFTSYAAREGALYDGT
jgi:hypothetical protein